MKLGKGLFFDGLFPQEPRFPHDALPHLRTFHTGDGLLEAVHWPHNGFNGPGSPVRLLAVYAGAEGLSNATPISR